MAQPAHCIRSVFGLQCFFLFLLTSQEAGAAALQELQKTGKSTSDHLFSLAPALVSITPSNHAALHSEHSSPDPLISTETHKPKHQCTTTHRSKLAHQSSTTQAAPPAAEQNPSKQGRGPIIRNERASEPNDTANTDQGSDGERHTTPVPNRKSTTCLKRTTSRSTVTSKPAKVVTPSTTSNKTTEKTKQNLGKVTDRKQSTTRGHERTSGSPEKSTEHEGKTTGDNKRATGASEKSTGHEGKTTSNHERTTETFVGTGHGEKITSGHERTTGNPETPREHEGKTTGTHYKTTGSPEKSTEHEGKTTGDNKRVTGASEKSTGHEEKTTSNHERTTETVGPSPGGEESTALAEGAQDPKGWRGLRVQEQRGSLSSRGARFPRRGRGPPSLEAPLDLRLRNSLPNRAQRQPESGSRSGGGRHQRATVPGCGLTTLASPSGMPRLAGSGGCPPTVLNPLMRKEAAGGCFSYKGPCSLSMIKKEATTSCEESLSSPGISSPTTQAQDSFQEHILRRRLGHIWDPSTLFTSHEEEYQDAEKKHSP
ncbi:hypothetical protein AB1E18_016727 [Capra hircus]